jgi:hypothetical protein
VRRVYEASLRQYDQYVNDFYSQSPASFGNHARAADTVNSDHRNSSNDPLEPSNPDELHGGSESVSSHDSRGEHFASDSEHSEPNDEQSIDDSDNDGEDGDPAWLEFLKINPDFEVHRQQYTETLEEAGLNEPPEGNWQDTFGDIRVGSVIMFQACGFVAASDPFEDNDLSWSPTPFGPMRTTTQLAIVERSFHDSVGVRDLMAFEDIPGHPERGQEAFDELYGETRYALEGYMHVVALDSDGLIRPEPRCFAGGVQCNWRSTKDAIPPRNKN